MADTPMNIIDKDRAYNLGKRWEPSFKLMNAVNFADLKIIAPSLNIYKDEVQYFDSEANEIHLGTDGLVDMFQVEDKEELYNALLYVQGHEEQHRRSTANVPYSRAIQRGSQEIVKYIAMMEGDAYAFRFDKDYNDYLHELKERGVMFNWDSIMQLIANIANSLEDGRIERIRSARLPGFAELKLYFRGKFWETQEQEYPSPEELKKNPIEKLSVLMLEILTLATTQLYSKGFVKAYAGTEILDEVNDLMPFIARGIMAGSVRHLEPEVVELSKRLAPYIYDAFKFSAEEVETAKAFEEMMKNLMKSLIENLPKEAVKGISLEERDEDKDDGGIDSTFEHSDLVITLDDETYDKLVEKSEEKKTGSGIMIRREHPKEEDEKDSEDKSPSDGKGKESDELESTSDGKTSLKPEENSSGESEESSSDNSEKGENKEKSEKNSGSANKKDGANSKDSSPEETAGEAEACANDSSKDAEDSDSEMSPSEMRDDAKNGLDKSDESRKGKAAEKGMRANGSKEDSDLAEKSILEAIRAAKESVKASAETIVGKINEEAGHARKVSGKIVHDTYPLVIDEDVRDCMDGHFTFREIKRSYEVDQPLPPVVAARGKALHKKMEKYFRSLTSPNIRNLDTGSVDPSRLFGLTIGDTDIFRRKGKNKLFDGCAYILIDNSGSMHGQKFVEACTAAAIIEEGFRGLFPIKIVSFNDNYQTVIHQVVKGWDESLRENCSWNYRVYGGPHGGNADGCSIAVATKELAKRHEKKKLLVVLSDGAPTEGGDNPIMLTKTAVENARKKRMQVTGIYFDVGKIGDDADTFVDIYKKDYVLCELSRLDAELTKTFIKFARS